MNTNDSIEQADRKVNTGPAHPDAASVDGQPVTAEMQPAVETASVQLDSDQQARPIAAAAALPLSRPAVAEAPVTMSNPHQSGL